MSNFLRPEELQHIRPPCPSLSPRVFPSSCPLNQWCYPNILSSALFFCLQSFPASGSFPMSRLFASGGQNIGASTSPSVLPMTTQGWFPLGWTGLLLIIFLKLSKGRGWMHCPCSKPSLGLSFMIMNEAPSGYLNFTPFNVQLLLFLQVICILFGSSFRTLIFNRKSFWLAIINREFTQSVYEVIHKE